MAHPLGKCSPRKSVSGPLAMASFLLPAGGSVKQEGAAPTHWRHYG